MQHPPKRWSGPAPIRSRILLLLLLMGCKTDAFEPRSDQPYDLPSAISSRSISFENPTGAPGNGGRAASPLGAGRKGAPSKIIAPGETVQLCDIEGPGTIHHIWMTTVPAPSILRSAVIRAYWDGQQHPSIEAPLGDFAGFAHGKVTTYQSAVHSVGKNAAMNIWLDMPFTRRARWSVTNEGKLPMPFFYQIDYTVGERHPADVGRLHVLFRRENPTTLKKDFELLPTRRGKGRFLGAVIGVRALDPRWWGEGEVKFYLDDDDAFPTIVGTGAEDYVGLSFGMQETPFRYHGASLKRDGFVSMYRWHLPDPVYWHRACRVTIQQIGHRGASRLWEDYPKQFFERQDDWSAATFWYEPVPSAPLPALPSVEARTRDIWPAVDAPWDRYAQTDVDGNSVGEAPAGTDAE